MVMRYPHQLMDYKFRNFRTNQIQDYIIERYHDYTMMWRGRKHFLERKRQIIDLWQNKYGWILPEEEIQKLKDIENEDPLLDHSNLDNSWCWWWPHHEMDRQYYQEWIGYCERQNVEQCIIRRKKQGAYDWLIDPYTFNLDINLIFNPTYWNRNVDKVTGIISVT